MLARIAIVLVLATGCGDFEEVKGDGETYAITVDSRVPIDFVTWYEGRECDDCATPVTPQQLAAGEVRTSGTLRIFYNILPDPLLPPRTDSIGGAAPVFVGPTLQLLVLGHRRDAAKQPQLVAAGIIDVEFGHDGYFTGVVRLTAERVPDLELWGANQCARVGDQYFIPSFSDLDCDGVLNADDCDELRYCDRTRDPCACT